MTKEVQTKLVAAFENKQLLVSYGTYSPNIRGDQKMIALFVEAFSDIIVFPGYQDGTTNNVDPYVKIAGDLDAKRKYFEVASAINERLDYAVFDVGELSCMLDKA